MMYKNNQQEEECTQSILEINYNNKLQLLMRNPSPVYRGRSDRYINTVSSCSPSHRSNMVTSLQNLNRYLVIDKQFQSVQQQLKSRSSRQNTISPQNTQQSEVLKQNQNVQNFYSQPTDQDNVQQYKIIQYTNNPSKENRKELCESIVKQYLSSDQKPLLRSNRTNQQPQSQQNSTQKIRSDPPSDPKMAQLVDENANLLKALKEKDKQLNMYKNTMQKLDHQLSGFQKQVESYKSDIRDLNAIVKQKNVEIKSLSVQIGQMANKAQGNGNWEEVPYLQAAKEQIEQALSVINVKGRQQSVRTKEFAGNLSLSTIKGEVTSNEIQDEHLPESKVRKCYGTRAVVKHESVESMRPLRDESITDIITSNLKKRFQQ